MLFILIVNALITVAVVWIPSTEPPVAAAELVTVWVALCRSRPVRQRKLWSTPSVLPPGSFPVIQLLVRCSEVHAVRAGTVSISWATVSPL